MKIELIQTDKLIPYARNPRKNQQAVGKVAASIKEFGFRQPIVVDPDMVIIAGHTRLQAAQQLGIEEVPVHVAENLTPTQIKALRIADNRTHEEAEWDTELLPLELADLQEADFDLNLTGFDDSELTRLLVDAVQSGYAQEDGVPEAPKDPVTQPGDLWLLGTHRLYCGDSTKPDDLAALMKDDIAAFSFTSPPYLDMRNYDDGFNASLDVLTQFIPAALPYCDFFAVNLGLSRKDGKINRFWDAYINAAEAAGLPLTAWNIWSKQGMGGSVANMNAMFPIEHEWILVFGGDKERVRRTKKNKRAGEFTGGTNRQKDGTTKRAKPKTVREYGRMGSVYVGAPASGQNPHPASFPVHLPYEYIIACSGEGDVIYEPFGGSGTTLIACEQTHRACRMMELSPRYCDVIIERWQNLTGKTAMHAQTNKAYAARD